MNVWGKINSSFFNQYAVVSIYMLLCLIGLTTVAETDFKITCKIVLMLRLDWVFNFELEP